MIALETYLKAAQERKAQEILLNPLQPIRLRVGKEFVTMNQPALTVSEMRQLVSQLLSDEEKKNLFENLQVRGSRSVGSVSFKFDFQVDFEGVTGSLIMQNQTKGVAQSQWNFPQIFIESLLKPKGLHLLAGSRRSGKTTAIQQILQNLSDKNRVIAFYSDEESQNVESKGNILSQFSIEQFRKNGVMKSADIIIFDTEDLKLGEFALQLSEQGRTVIFTVSSWNIQMALQRFLDLCEGLQAASARRISMTLQSIVGLNLVPGLEASFQGAFEMLLSNSEMQGALREQNYLMIGNLMKSLAEKTGMRSLNQSLFQLLIKRKIELKTAFEFSPDPEELDSLLKKVGI